MISSDKNCALLLEAQLCKPISLRDISPQTHFDVECKTVAFVMSGTQEIGLGNFITVFYRVKLFKSSFALPVMEYQ